MDKGLVDQIYKADYPRKGIFPAYPSTSLMEEQFSEFDELIEVFGPDLRDFVARRVGVEEEADDLVQDVWFAFFRSISRGSLIENPRAWLYRAARNRLIDGYRKIRLDRSEQELDEMANSEKTEDELYRDEFYNLLESALDEIPEKQRDVFLKNEIEDLTLREIAEQEGVSLKTIISRKRYAVSKLRSLLGQYYDDFFSAD